MTCTDSNIKIIPPFVQGLAGCFDIAGFFDDITLSIAENDNPLIKDWQAISSDYNNSIKLINEELHGIRKNKRL